MIIIKNKKCSEEKIRKELKKNDLLNDKRYQMKRYLIILLSILMAGEVSA